MVVQAPPPQWNQPQQVVPTSGLATASMVLGIIGFLGGWCMFGLPSFVAILLGHMALRETANGRRGGHGMAVTGLILGYPFAALWAVVGVFWVLGSLGVQ